MNISLASRPLLLFALAALVACSDGAVNTDPRLLPGPAQMDIVSGQDQTAPPGTQLPSPLVVRVTDGSGNPVPGRIVNFRVTSGGGSVFAGSALTNESGVAQEWWTLGPSLGTNTLEARAVDSGTGEKLVYATFRATAQESTEPAPVAQITVSPLSSSIPVGGTVTLTATLTDADGNVLTDRSVSWSNSDSQVASLSSAGFATADIKGLAAGTVTITATSEGKSAVAQVQVTSSSTSSGLGPQPGSTSRILLDTRAGGSSDIQASGVTQTQALAFLDYPTKNVSFIADFDGQGTAAYRHTFAGQNGACVDVGAQSMHYLDAPLPREMYVSWKMWMGRTAADQSGGIGEVGHFDITSDACPQDAAGRKMWRFLRNVPDGGGNWSFDLLWGGPTPGATPFFCCWQHPDNTTGTRRDPQYQPEDHYNKVLTQTIYMKAASSNTVADGVVKMWVNGVLVGEWSDIPMGAMEFHRFQWPMIIRGPVKDMTEYWWDLVAWAPQ